MSVMSVMSDTCIVCELTPAIKKSVDGAIVYVKHVSRTIVVMC